MKESDLLADLATVFPIATASQAVQVEDAKGVTWMMLNVFDTGTINNKPVASQRNLTYYVYHKGQADEAAYYADQAPKSVFAGV